MPKTAKTKPAKVTLPKIPSQLIRIALKDLEKAERTPKTRINMGTWYDTNGSCTVCLAGSVMANTLKEQSELVKAKKRIEYPSFYNDGSEFNLYPDLYRSNSSQLFAINNLREGTLDDAARRLGLSYSAEFVAASKQIKEQPFWRERSNECGDTWYIPQYRSNRARFKSAMRKMASIFEKHGL